MDDSKVKLEEKIHQLAIAMEKMKIAEYIEYMNNTRRLLFINFIAGLARGFGMAIGFTVLAALVLYILQKLVILNLPLIGDAIAHIVKLVNYSLQK